MLMAQYKIPSFLGRSKIVGTPVAELLKWHHATVTICHSKTKNLKAIVSQADILVVGIGQANFVKVGFHLLDFKVVCLIV